MATTGNGGSEVERTETDRKSKNKRQRRQEGDKMVTDARTAGGKKLVKPKHCCRRVEEFESCRY